MKRLVTVRYEYKKTPLYCVKRLSISTDSLTNLKKDNKHWFHMCAMASNHWNKLAKHGFHVGFIHQRAGDGSTLVAPKEPFHQTAFEGANARYFEFP